MLLERTSKNRLNPSKTTMKLQELVTVAGRNGIHASLEELSGPIAHGDEHAYRAKLNIEKNGMADGQFRRAMGNLAKKALASGWTVADGGLPLTQPKQKFVVPGLGTDVLSQYFAGIYDREPHIRIIHDSVGSYIDSLRKYDEDKSIKVSRSHVLLKGKPGSCKTTLFERFKRWYDSTGGERVIFVDGPQVTKAGLDNWLLDLADDDELPEILVIEEIEKQNLDNLLVLISLMGSGYVSKLNARVGRRCEQVNTVVWATCNDESVIQNFRHGVLWSRFTHKLHCSRPSQTLVHRILLDKIIEIEGNPAWADKAIEFAYHWYVRLTGAPMEDLREICGLLDGRDRLLDGSFQLDLQKVIESERLEKGLMNDNQKYADAVVFDLTQNTEQKSLALAKLISREHIRAAAEKFVDSENIEDVVRLAMAKLGHTVGPRGATG